MKAAIKYQSGFTLGELLIVLVIIAIICAIALPNIPHRVENVIFKNCELIDGEVVKFTIARGDQWVETYALINVIEVSSRDDGTTYTTLSGRLLREKSWRKVTIWVGNEDDLRAWQEYLQKMRRRVLPPETP